ncbi:MAG: hypothetical protein VX777_07580 [Chlamydiota bacterium]|nr:hypothetical protein [Chlamydiota bacterium]
MLTFVTHYEQLSDEDKEKILDRCDTFMHWNPLKLIELSFSSIKKYHPNSRTIVITNLKSKVSLSSDIEVIRFPTDKYENRLSQMVATLAFLKEWKEFSHLIFHDFDMLFQRNIESIFDGKNDIYLVKRGGPLTKKAPVNMGLVGIDQASISQAIRFYHKIINQMLTFPDYHIWTGSQISVHKLLYHELLQHPNAKEVVYDKIKFSFLPEEYNFTPEGNFEERRYQEAVLHFKGQRKPQMINYI